MREKIDLFLPCDDLQEARFTTIDLHEDKTVQHINLLVSADFAAQHPVPEGCTFIAVDRLESSNTVESIAENTDADYVLICTKNTDIQWGNLALERFLRVADDTGAVMVYSDHYTKVLDEEETAKFQASLGEDASEQEKSLRVSKLEKHPVIDYQQGSLRDDFDFGSLWLIKAQALRDYVAQRDRQEYLYAGLYDLRLI